MTNNVYIKRFALPEKSEINPNLELFMQGKSYYNEKGIPYNGFVVNEIKKDRKLFFLILPSDAILCYKTKEGFVETSVFKRYDGKQKCIVASIAPNHALFVRGVKDRNSNNIVNYVIFYDGKKIECFIEDDFYKKIKDSIDAREFLTRDEYNIFKKDNTPIKELSRVEESAVIGKRVRQELGFGDADIPRIHKSQHRIISARKFT